MRHFLRCKIRRISRWEHEEVLEAVQQRLDENPQAMRQCREAVEHLFGTIKRRPGATHFLMKWLKNVRTETALSVRTYDLTSVINILGIAPLIQPSGRSLVLPSPKIRSFDQDPSI